MNADDMAPSGVWVKLTKGDTTLSGVRGLLVGTGGTANLTTLTNADTDAVPLAAGYHPLKIKKLRSGGTVDDVWALY